MYFFLVLKFESSSHVLKIKMVRSDQGGSQNLFSWNYENKYSYVTFVCDDHKQFGAQKGCNHPKHYVSIFVN